MSLGACHFEGDDASFMIACTSVSDVCSGGQVAPSSCGVGIPISIWIAPWRDIRLGAVTIARDGATACAVNGYNR